MNLEEATIKALSRNLKEDNSDLTDYMHNIDNDNNRKDDWYGNSKNRLLRLSELTDFGCDWCGGVFKATYPTKRNGNNMPVCPYCGLNKDVHKLDKSGEIIY